MSEQQRAAMQAALEALQLANMNGAAGLHRNELQEVEDAMDALRAALAEPKAEPEAWHHPDCQGECIACLIEREVQVAFGNQGVAYLRRHVTMHQFTEVALKEKNNE